MKRTWRLIFGLLLLAGPAAEAQFSYSTNADDTNTVTITGYTGPGGAVTIPTTNSAGLLVTGIGGLAFSGTELTSVTIPGSVTTIGEEAFGDCSDLTNATMANGLTSVGGWVFVECSNLTTVTIPNSVSYIGVYAFYGCSSLTSVTVPNSVTNIGDQAFAGCPNLTSVTIPAGVTNIGSSAFGAYLDFAAPGVLSECASLKAITVDAQNSFYSSSNGVLFDKSGATLVQYPGGLEGSYTIPGTVATVGDFAFAASPDLTSVTIPASVSSIGEYAFAYCGSLTNATIANGVTNIGLFAFFGCSNLSSISIPGSVTCIEGDAFTSCTSLTNATMAKGVRSVGLFAFLGCSNLTSITIPGSVTNIEGDALSFCSSLASVYFNGNAPVVDSTVFEDDDSDLVIYYLPETAGWSSPFANRPAVLWNPLIQTGDGHFGFNGNQFGFDIAGTANIPIVIEACTNLANPVWSRLQTLTLTNGLFYFSEPMQTNGSGRFYRISSP